MKYLNIPLRITLRLSFASLSFFLRQISLKCPSYRVNIQSRRLSPFVRESLRQRIPMVRCVLVLSHLQCNNYSLLSANHPQGHASASQQCLSLRRPDDEMEWHRTWTEYFMFYINPRMKRDGPISAEILFDIALQPFHPSGRPIQFSNL